MEMKMIPPGAKGTEGRETSLLFRALVRPSWMQPVAPRHAQATGLGADHYYRLVLGAVLVDVFFAPVCPIINGHERR